MIYRYLALACLSALLLGCSGRKPQGNAWWNGTNKVEEKPAQPKWLKWAECRLLVPDTTIHHFLRELLEQGEDGKVFMVGWPLGKVLIDKRSLFLPLWPGRPRPWNNPELGDSAFIALVSHDHLLTAADTVFMHQQMATSSGFRLDAKLLPGYLVIPEDTLTETTRRLRAVGQRPDILDEVNKRYGVYGYSSISMPLFSRDYSTAIVDVWHSCGGLCGRGETFVVRKKNGKWKVMKVITGFVA
ncbi:hypothetical protein [Solirubrum puertoriconensis]|uniref:Uncharacterized protein n=1 Tax=Solirubrum puertoriconensis TaxID=1751427 RepID=A0A9X0HIQ2_SOLP1|nr:hypothetical protein [Solirubrum puertoriconensis]KUG06579.1 hypothetical protein ASU33_04335 [Solirubrum puertoriconensis]